MNKYPRVGQSLKGEVNMYLEDKLVDILGGLQDMYTIEPELTYDQAIAQIKALFSDEGYVTGVLTETEQGYMTGTAWYARFEQQFNPADTDCAEFYVGTEEGCDPIEHARRSGRFEVMMEAHTAAQKASGL